MAGIVIHGLNTVYWFIPKNACTTLKIHYANLLGLQFYNGHDADFEYTDEIIPEYFNFAIVRHPFQRLYSCWANKIAEGHPVADDFVNGIDINVFDGLMDKVYLGMPFEEFALLVMNPATKRDPHWAPQSEQVPEEIHFFKIEEQLILKALLPTLNKDHTGGEWQNYFSLPLILEGRRYYSEDFNRYGYRGF